VLVRSSVTEHGMAYGPRGLRSRSANSSRGRDAPPGSAGKPRAGRSGAGGEMSEPVRYARCGPPQQVTSSVEAVRSTPLESGLRSKDLRAVRRGAVGKVPGGQLAGRLPYRTLRSEGRGWRQRHLLSRRMEKRTTRYRALSLPTTLTPPTYGRCSSPFVRRPGGGCNTPLPNHT
jgi:hypothetical protein